MTGAVTREPDQPVLREDPHPQEHGVLLCNRIEEYARRGMLHPFDHRKLKSAGYRLSVGDEYLLGGVQFRLRGQDSLVIPPYQVAVIKTAEYIQMPWFLIGRWNILVRRAYEGLLWVGAAQVDPGYEGHLMCPIYNLSNKEVRLYRGESLALIDFVKTTRLNHTRIKSISHEFGHFGKGLESGLLSNREQVDSLSNRLAAVEQRIWLFATLVIGMIGIGVALASKNALSAHSGEDWLWPLALGLASASASLSVLWVVGLLVQPLLMPLRTILSQRFTNVRASWNFAIGPLFALFFLLGLYFFADPGRRLVETRRGLEAKYQELDQKYQDLKQRVEKLNSEPK